MPGMLSGENFSQAAFSNNRLTGFGYDAAGNTTTDGINSYVYNAENQIAIAAGVSYTYDGDGNRVKKSSGRLYWYGAMGIMAESDSTGTLTAEYTFFDGMRIARRDYPSGAIHYYFSDRLKSTSVVTTSAGLVEEESDYRPWGEEKTITHTLADQHYKFNGKERDTETGFDEFGARLYSSAWSRWLTPDWSADATPVPYAQMDNPQSLNLYQYALSNPATLPDFDGHLTPLGGGSSNADGAQAQDLPQDPQQQLAEQTQGAGKGQLDLSDPSKFYTDPGSGICMDLNNPKRNLDAAQASLSFTSMLPGANLLISPLNAGISLMRGDSSDAGMSLAAALPLGGFGKEVALAAKLGKEGEEAAGIVKNSERIASATGTAKY